MAIMAFTAEEKKYWLELSQYLIKRRKQKSEKTPIKIFLKPADLKELLIGFPGEDHDAALTSH